LNVRADLAHVRAVEVHDRGLPVRKRPSVHDRPPSIRMTCRVM
jgi:hypothetical protein